MKILSIALLIVAVLFVVGWLGLKVQPRPFPNYPKRTPELKTIPLPSGLPAPVERYFRTLYGDQIPVIDTVVMTGRAVIKPVMNIPLPSRFVFVHVAGKDYRHYFESTFFGIPFLRVNEGILDGNSFFESPMGTYHDDPNTNQAANLALWGEGAWFPSIWITDPRAHWAPVDENTAVLYVPYEDQEETFVVRFNPQTHLVDMMEAMRYRNPGDTQKILWLPQNIPGGTAPGVPVSASGSAMWLDQGHPWANFTVEDIVYNVDVSEYIRRRGF